MRCVWSLRISLCTFVQFCLLKHSSNTWQYWLSLRCLLCGSVISTFVYVYDSIFLQISVLLFLVIYYFLWRQSSQGSYCQTRIDCCQKKIGWTRKERRPHVWVVNIRLSCVLIISVAHPLYGNQPQSNKTWQCSLFEMEEGCRKEIGSFLTILLPSASPSSSAVQNLHIPDNRTKKDLIIVWAIWWMCRGI